LDAGRHFAHASAVFTKGFLMHYGWVIVGACLVVGVCGYGTYFSFTLFYPLLVDEFGWSRAAISGAMSTGLIVYGLFALPMGWCVDRFGPRRTIAVGGVIFGCGTCLGAFITEIWHLYALYGGLMAIGMGAAWAPLVSTISRWFVTRRGLAVGIGSLGGGTGIFFVAPLADSLIQQVGWREAYLWLGVVSGGLIVAAALFLDRDPSAKGMAAYGAADRTDRTIDEQSDDQSGRPRIDAFLASRHSLEVGADDIWAIVRTWLFWRMILTFGFWWFGGAIVCVQLAPYLVEKGFDLQFAALAVVAFGAGNGVGKIMMGMTSDRFGELFAYQISIVIAATSMFALAFSLDAQMLLVMTAIFGFGFGGASTQLTTISVALFGMRSVGALMGAVLALIGIVGAGGPLLSGLIFDAVGSYTLAYMVGAGVFLLSLLFSMSLRR
jgi:OFA family oxalate/formate antiporter-like MFS transporter